VFDVKTGMIESFMFVLHRRETLSAGLLEDFEETRYVCHKRAKGRKHSASVRTKEVGAALESITRKHITPLQRPAG
jgi:hypothetical protein